MKRCLLLASLAPMLSFATASASEGGRPPSVNLFGLTFAHHTVIWCALVALAVWLVCWLVSRGFSKEKPGKGQVVLEMVLTAFHDLLLQSIGKNRGPQFLAAIVSLFLFIWVGNMLCLFPAPQITFGGEAFSDYDGNGVYSAGEPFADANGNGIHDPGFTIPAPTELPTNLSFPLALAVLFITCMGQGYALRYHGFLGWVKSYFSPGGIIGVVMMPMNIVGKIAEHVSISFRIFGNLYGGSIIFSVISGLLFFCLLPIPMYAYFGVFAGTIQAFVFAMLSLTYISMEIAEETEEDEEDSPAGHPAATESRRLTASTSGRNEPAA